MSKTFAEKLKEDRRLVILRLLSETRGYTLNSSQVLMNLSMMSIPATRSEVIEDLRFLDNNGLVKMTPISGIENLYGVVLTNDGDEVAKGLRSVVGVNTPGPR